MVDNDILKFSRKVNEFGNHLEEHSDWDVVWENDEVVKDKVLREIYDNNQEEIFEQYQKDRIEFSELILEGHKMCDSETLFGYYIRLDIALQNEEYEMAGTLKNDIINFIKDETPEPDPTPIPDTINLSDSINGLSEYGLMEENHEEVITELISKISGSEIKRWQQNECGYIEMSTNFQTMHGTINKIYVYSKSGLDTGNVELFFEDKKVIFHPKAIIFNKLFKKMNSLYMDKNKKTTNSVKDESIINTDVLKRKVMKMINTILNLFK